MKKRKIKDFIALYAPEDEEKLVLIQSGTSADKTFLDTFWAAHTHALALSLIHIFRLLQHLSRMIQNRLEDERKGTAGMTERKLKRKIDEKKQAHGLRQG